MRRLILILFILGAILLRPGVATPALAQSDCGTDRPSVQTLTDPNAGDLDTGQLIGVNLSTLASLPLPEGLAPDTRYNPYETTIWATVGQLVQAQIGAGGAIDLTLSDPESGDTITVVFPDAVDCAASAEPSLLQLMEQARETFVQTYGMPPASGTLPLSGLVEVAGVGFIAAGSSADQGGTGSGIELSPVLAFAPAPTAASPAVPATPAPGAAGSATPNAPPAQSPTPAATPPAGG